MDEIVTLFVDMETDGLPEDYLEYTELEFNDKAYHLDRMGQYFRGTRHEDFHLLGVF